MIIDDFLLSNSTPEIRKTVEDFHYGLGRYYDVTVIPSNNSKIEGTSWSEYIDSGEAVLLVVNRSGYRYRENRDIKNVIAYTLELNPDLAIIKKSSPNYDLFLFTFDKDLETESFELNKPKKNLIKRKTKKEKETGISDPGSVQETGTAPEPIKVNFDADPYAEENSDK